MRAYHMYYEPVETTCPDCGSDATYDDTGLHCSNPDCENS